MQSTNTATASEKAPEYVARKLAHVPSWQHVRWQAAENDNQRGERARKLGGAR